MSKEVIFQNFNNLNKFFTYKQNSNPQLNQLDIFKISQEITEIKKKYREIWNYKKTFSKYVMCQEYNNNKILICDFPLFKLKKSKNLIYLILIINFDSKNQNFTYVFKNKDFMNKSITILWQKYFSKTTHTNFKLQTTNINSSLVIPSNYAVIYGVNKY